MRYSPAAHAATPIAKLERAYIANIPIFPLCRSARFSLANVLNVVKPPQKPITKKSLRFGDKLPHLRKSPEKIPMQKQPRIFATNVGHGNPATLGITKERMYRSTLPRAPPMATSK